MNRKRFIICGIFEETEDQMLGFPVDASIHDDMVDALVYALTELSGRGGYGVKMLTY